MLFQKPTRPFLPRISSFFIVYVTFVAYFFVTIVYADVDMQNVMEQMQQIQKQYAGKIIDSLNKISVQLTLGDENWHNTGIDEAFISSIEWDVVEVRNTPRRYWVLYRIDPRFDRAQVFVNKDFLEYKNHLLRDYQQEYQNGARYQTIFRDYSEYFNERAPTLMPVTKGDAVHIQIIPTESFIEFFGGELIAPRGERNIPNIIYTASGNFDNRILHCENIQTWCNAIGEAKSKARCEQSEFISTYDASENTSGWVTGDVRDSAVPNSTIFPCSDGAQTVCYMDKGLGVEIAILDRNLNTLKTIKKGDTPFIYQKSDVNQNEFLDLIIGNGNFFDFVVPASGFLAFDRAYQINGIFSGFGANMKNWDYPNFQALQDAIADTRVARVHFGRYAFLVEIGKSDAIKSSDIKMEYMLYDNMEKNVYAIPDKTTSGTVITDGTKIALETATKSLWLRATSKNKELSGNVTAVITVKRSTAGMLSSMQSNIIEPAQNAIKKASTDFYSSLILRRDFQNFVMIAASLYIALYGLLVISGHSSFEFHEVLQRIMKIGLVVLLIKPESWYIFNHYFLDIFTSFCDSIGNYMQYGQGAQRSGILSALDKIFSQIFSLFPVDGIGDIFAMLFTSWSGFYAILIIIGIYNFSVVILSVVLAYVTSYLGIMLMICMAPLAIICLLFETTKDITKQWVSILFFQALRPILMFIFLAFFANILVTSMQSLFLPFTVECKVPAKKELCLSFFSAVAPEGESRALFMLSYAQRVFSFLLYCLAISTLNRYVQSILGMITGHSKDTGNNVF